MRFAYAIIDFSPPYPYSCVMETEMACRVCFSAFTTKNPKGRFCGKRCRDMWRNARRRVLVRWAEARLPEEEIEALTDEDLSRKFEESGGTEDLPGEKETESLDSGE